MGRIDVGPTSTCERHCASSHVRERSGVEGPSPSAAVAGRGNSQTRGTRGIAWTLVTCIRARMSPCARAGVASPLSSGAWSPCSTCARQYGVREGRVHVRGGRRRRGPFIRALREAYPQWLLLGSVRGGHGDQVVSGYTRYCTHVEGCIVGLWTVARLCCVWSGCCSSACVCAARYVPCAGVCARARRGAVGRALALSTPEIP